MKRNLTFTSLPLLALFLVLAPVAYASTTWYVDGVHGSNVNNCKASTTACKTIGHVISLASSGDTVKVAAATYTENLTIGISLNVLGAGANTTIIDGNAAGRVITISSVRADVTLSGLTITNGLAFNNGIGAFGGGIANLGGTLSVKYSTIRGNRAVISCSTYCSSGGAGIYNTGTLTVIAGTLSANGAVTGCLNLCGADGGGITTTAAWSQLTTAPSTATAPLSGTADQFAAAAAVESSTAAR